MGRLKPQQTPPNYVGPSYIDGQSQHYRRPRASAQCPQWEPAFRSAALWLQFMHC
ncbi:hypothetical protein BDI4_1080018 [Burkholderia diffusa]|nr:hypothetical protein BDI4_1080018 [Burkholderia diffusa]